MRSNKTVCKTPDYAMLNLFSSTAVITQVLILFLKAIEINSLRTSLQFHHRIDSSFLVKVFHGCELYRHSKLNKLEKLVTFAVCN